jgi:hypothetical protein
MVEAKEKALEIFNEHYFYLRANLMYDEEAKEDAIECALITVNRIINANGLHPNDTDYDYSKAEIYWQEVKREIKNMRDQNV